MSYTSMLELVVVVVDIVLATVSASSTKEPCNRLSLLTEALMVPAATSSCCSLREVTLLDDASRDKAETMVLVMLSAALHANQSLSPR